MVHVKMPRSTKVAQDVLDERTDTRKNIKVAARRLFAEHGLEAVTVREIVAAAGAKNGGSLNYYFKSKEGLVLELINEIFNDLSVVWFERISELIEKVVRPAFVKSWISSFARQIPISTRILRPPRSAFLPA